MIVLTKKSKILKTTVTYKGNGTQTNFDFPFDYLRKSFVKVTIDDKTVTEFSVDNRTVRFDTPPKQDSIIVIYRETSTDLLVSWADASVLKASDMTIAQIQQLHIIEEGQEWSELNSIYLDKNDNKWQGNNHPIKNVSDPVDAKDVVTKGYMETVQDGFIKANTALKDEATKQASIATKIATDLGLVDEAVQTAVSSAEQASNSAATASEKVDVATAKAEVATAKAEVATAKAEVATAKAEVATAKAEIASKSAISAAQSYTNANAVATQLTEYLATKETLTAPAVDKTLLIEGAAADSKVVGEVNDSVIDMASELNTIGGIVSPLLNWTRGKYVSASTNTIIAASESFLITDYIPIPSWTTKVITNPNRLNVAWQVSFYDENKTFISGVMNPYYKSAEFEISEIPTTSKYLIVTTYDDGAENIFDKVYVNFASFERLATIEKGLSDLQNELVLDKSYLNILVGASTFTDRKFINNKGDVVNNPNFCLIDGYYSINPNTVYELYRDEPALFSNAGHNWTWWDKNKNFISYQLSGQPVTSPENAEYLRFAIYIDNTGETTHETFDPTKVIITESSKPCFDINFSSSFVTRPTLKGLKWIGVGDSITEDNFRAKYHYHDYIKAETGLTFVNMGISGTGYKAEGSGDKAFYKRVVNMDTDADIITIFGGVNDVVLTDADIGTETDTGTATICGCVNTTLDAIESLYPAHMPIGIISPLPCACVDTVVNLHPLQNPNDDTCRMAVFVEQLRLICKHRGIPFLDLFHQSNLRPWNEKCREKYFSCDSAKSGDGLHPNGYGHRLIYRQIMDFVLKIAMS